MATEQEEFWKGDFGVSYLERNRVDWQKRIPFWESILAQTKPESILEVGTNAGWNLRAIRSIDPMISLIGCDINKAAVAEAQGAGFSVVECSVFDLRSYEVKVDLVFTAGVLIHIAPADIELAMASIIAASTRHVLAVEYASDKEEEIPYRGHSERLWKRPFGKLYEGLGLKLIAEGEAQGFDRCHYWLMEKP